jgi:hypothetical protein
MKRLQALARPEPPKLTSSARRGRARQHFERRREQELRGHVVDLRQRIEAQGWPCQKIAELLHLAPRTLRHWQNQPDSLGGLHLQPMCLGRPAHCSPPKMRNQVIALLDELGPALGVPGLRQAFPDLARAELQDILWRYRRVWRKRHYLPLRILHWQVPGTVLAIDFAEATRPIEGIYDYLLAVRDLASGRQLLWLPVEHADHIAVEQALTALFALHGAPLVLKCDNGSPFAAAFENLFQAAASALVPGPLPIILYSPPYTPAYNGSIEAGIGSLKNRTEAHASRHGHPGYWTMDDVAAAQAEANATARPHGPSGPTPDEIWQVRAPITADERALFHASVDQARTALRAQPDCPQWPETGPLTVRQERALDRQAIRRALEEHGYLLYSRRRIPLRINAPKAATIT